MEKIYTLASNVMRSTSNTSHLIMGEMSGQVKEIVFFQQEALSPFLTKA
ncbi:7168_t:CDS:2 [Ambispora gerdemannii]|uniref:7168_t:CDS:1 n=1 Tax=Ambispora gerdemannii TaxID=144530 RepID=A0A9N9B0L0_9GLOM|nr:7168_t:CDS:2 [Ambispora gerdemannii]